MSAPPPRIRVGVFAAAERERLRVLFDALEDAFPALFEARLPGELRELDAVIEIGGEEQACAAAAAGLPALAMFAREPTEARGNTALELTGEACLDRRLRRAVLPDPRLEAVTALGEDRPEGTGRATVLARSAGRPVWTRAGSIDRAALAPAEMRADEALRERLRDGRSAALLPLVHMLRELTAAIRWQPPQPHAALLFDDPNLHWPTYGFVRLAEVGQHAREHGYHVALATIPLDGWFAHPGALGALRQSEGALSLLVHGNDHTSGELGRLATEVDGIALAAQALRRVNAFEGRTGVRVDRVMAPPHERCSEGTVRGLLRCGFEAISMTRPFSWYAEPPRSWLAWPDTADALSGWRPADVVAGGMPVLLRHPLVERRAPEMALRAFLDQPLILYGHHGDLADGLEVLAGAVEEVNALGPTRWGSLGEIAAASFETRLENSCLRVRPLSRRARIEIPSDADEISIELPPSHTEPGAERVTVDGRPLQLDGRASEPLAVSPGSTVELELRRLDYVDPRTIASPRPRPLVIARRVVGESRDRLQPVLARVR